METLNSAKARLDKIARGERVEIPAMSGPEAHAFCVQLMDAAEKYGVTSVEAQRLMDVVQVILEMQGKL